MDPMLISIWGPQMRRALLIYFGDHGVPNPDPGDVACLTAIGIAQIDRANLGFKSTSFLGMASLLVPAFLDPNHIRHGEIKAAVQACRDQLGAAAVTPIAAMAVPKKATGSLAETVKLAPAAKLPLLGKRAKAFAKMAAVKAAPKRSKAAPKRRGTK